MAETKTDAHLMLVNDFRAIEDGYVKSNFNQFEVILRNYSSVTNLHFNKKKTIGAIFRRFNGT